MTAVTRPALSVCVPSSWRRRSRPEHGIVVAARAPSMPGSGVRPELVLRAVPVDDDDAVAWRRRALDELAEVLDDFALEDDDGYDLEGREVRYHRFAHRVGVADVLCDQWCWLVDGRGVVLTCSAARSDYPDWCDLFEAVAATVEVSAGGAGDGGHASARR